jgi:DNA-binding response OmpR family regulator
MVVDDDPLSLELMREYLDPSSYRLVTAVDGADAWTQLQAIVPLPDVVLTDRVMPRMNGLELLQRIKAHPDMAALPVIMVTSASDRSEVIEGIDAGAYYYLVKPIDRDILRSMVRAAVSDHARLKELQREVRIGAGTLGLLREGRFEFRTPVQATDLGTLLAKACPDSERIVLGLTELLVNAVEHGNLEISYDEKSELTRTRALHQEIARRLEMPDYRDRVATVTFERTGDAVRLEIRDQGPGFDPEPFLTIDPRRVFDSHGRGIAIARLLSFDRLEYSDGGRRVVGWISGRGAGST